MDHFRQHSRSVPVVSGGGALGERASDVDLGIHLALTSEWTDFALGAGERHE